MKLSNKQKKILGWVLLTPPIVFVLLVVLSLLILFPRLLLVVGFIACVVSGLFLINSVED